MNRIKLRGFTLIYALIILISSNFFIMSTSLRKIDDEEDHDPRDDLGTNSFIVVNYTGEASYRNYEYGFLINETIKEIRKFINSYQIVDNYYFPNDLITIIEDWISVYFEEDTNSLAQVFNANLDENMKTVDQIMLWHFNITNIKDWSSTFKGMEKLQIIDYPEDSSMTSPDTINSIFEDCISLEIIDFTHFDISKIKDWTSAFKGCKKLKKIIFPTDLIAKPK